ncbi:FAD-binding oxidoreductase [Natrinema amylolyticum]|uniref:FAD-binding oxidoreductase n=1 Tax=Natrinema amylolyticum TaxID=2878679 RepID=UPI001CFA37ED|nr:FAD-binding oxidoreductase [Natrinema amylolyticum]
MTTTEPLESTTVQTFREQLHGEVLQPDDEGYDEARSVWNAMIDKEPALIACCTGASDVIAAVNFARDLDLELAVHGGGHNVAGKAVCDGGLMIDLSPMDSVRVDPDARTARVGGGATWADFDHEAQAFGLATTGGIVSSTGVAGVTLGGGLGYLSRTYGLAHDNLSSMDVVTADGELVQASPEANADLFWGMRGGLGNFGITTSFEFDLHEVGPEVLAGRIIHPYEAAPAFLRRYRDFMHNAPDDMQAYAAFIQGNPAMGMPEQLHGETLVGAVVLYSGDIDEGREVIQPLRDFGEPVADMVGPTPYVQHQQSSDELYQEGHRNYWKSHFFDELTDEAIDTIVKHVDPLPTPFTTVFFEWMGGAIARRDSDATAFPHRNATVSFTVAPKWTDPAADEEMIEWAREFFNATARFATDDVYVNYLSWDEQERAKSAYGDHYERLIKLKRKYDPDNLFRVNQNLDPRADREG